MSGLFIACVVLMIVSTTFLIGVICYCKGRFDERTAWNKHLGLPERTPDKPYFTSQDIGKRVTEKASSRTK